MDYTATTAAVSNSVIAFTALLIGLPLVTVVLYLRIDYRRHRKPLLEIDPMVHYTFFHHVKVVTIPLLSYRISFYVSKKTK